jgi:hypothetical protein
MAKSDADDLAALTAKRATFRLNHVGTKLNERELRAFAALAEQRNQTQGEFIRGLILAEIERDKAAATASPEMVEIVGLRLLLINLLRPAAIGQLMAEKRYDDLVAETRKRKVQVAQDTLEVILKEQEQG